MSTINCCILEINNFETKKKLHHWGSNHLRSDSHLDSLFSQQFEICVINEGFTLKPASVMSDFESAIINAVGKIFPNTDTRGCFFHFSQSVFKHIQQAPDILSKYKSDS